MFDMPAPPPPERSVKWGGILVSVGLLFGGCCATVKDSKDGEQPARPTTAAEFAAAKTPSDLPSAYVVFQPDKLIVTGVSVLEGRRHKNRYDYNLVKLGNRYAVVRSETGLSGRITARAVPTDYDGGREAMRWRPKARYLPYSFDAASSPPREASAVGVVGLLVMGAGAVVMFRSIYCGRSKAEQYANFAEAPPVGWRWSAR